MLQHFRHVSKYRLFLIIKRGYCEKVANLWYGSPKSLSNSVNGISNSAEIQVMQTCRWWVRNLFHIPSFHGLFHLNVNVHQYQISSIVTVLCIFKKLQDVISYYHVTIRMPAHAFLTSHPITLYPWQYPFQTHQTLQIWQHYRGFVFKENNVSKRTMFKNTEGVDLNNFLCINPSKTNRHLHKLGVKSYKYESRLYLQTQFEETNHMTA